MERMVDASALHWTYRQLYDAIGEANMMRVYALFSGDQVQFPMRLYDRELASKRILAQFDGHNARELASRYGYSQRWVYQVLKEKRDSE